MLSDELTKRRKRPVKSLLVIELEYVLRHELSIHLSALSYDMYFDVKRAHQGLVTLSSTVSANNAHSYDLVNIHKVIDAFY